MTPAQNAAFAAANGGHSPSEISTLVGSIFLILVFMWAAWLVARTLAAFMKGNAREMDFVWVGLRVSALITIAIWWVNA